MQIVLLQILVIWFVVIWVYRRAARRDGQAPVDDVGFFWLGILALYATLPPLFWLLQGGSYDPLAGRLFQLQPTVNEIIYLLNIALAYTLGFTAVYGVLLKHVGRPIMEAQVRISGAKMIGAGVIVAAGSLVLAMIGWMGLIPVAKSYGDSYRVIAELPLGLRQIIRMVGGFSSVATLVFITALFQRWPRYRWLLIAYLLLIVATINPGGSRAGVATDLLAIVIAWHILVRPIPTGKLLAGGVFGLIVFQFLGICRGVGGVPSIEDFMRTGISISEFESLWTNAVDLLRIKQSGGLDVSFTTRFGELFSFVPSQLLWFSKSSLADWYLDTFYPVYKAAGGGLAFGVISQAVIGSGIFEAAIRGAILGALAGWIMKWVRTPSNIWWKLPVHLYMLVWIYQCVRDTTFSLLGGIVQTVLPAMVVIAIIAGLVCRKRKPCAESAEN